MEILRERLIKTSLSTIGPVSIDGIFQCYFLEPKDRGLTSTMTLAEIEKIKVFGKTAIPTGRYRIEKYYSPDHGAWVLRLMNVPGFGYVEIHVGNFPHDTEACSLAGENFSKDYVGGSKLAIDALYHKLFPILDAGKEEIWITYK